MPRDRSLRSQIVATGFVASASRRTTRKVGHTHKLKQEKWQTRAWHYFDTVGEYRSACSWIGNLLSKARLYVEGPDGKEVTSGPAFEALDALYGGPEGHAEMLRLFGTHLTVGGDCYLVGESRGGGQDDDWQIVSNIRMKDVALANGEHWYRIEDEDEDLDPEAFVMRLWRGHPLDRKRGDSNSRAALTILAELETLTKRVAADSDSRLTGNGLLLVPNEVTFAALPVTTETPEGGDAVAQQAVRQGADGIMDTLIEVAALSMQDQESAVAKVPLVLQMPGEQISKVKHLTFWSGFDEQTKGLREEAIQRIALSMDMPPEVLTGTAGMNHWGSWQVGEEAIKTYAEPLLELITSGLTRAYLWAMLDMDDDEARGYKIRSDLTEAKLRPNRSKEAGQLYDRGVLTAKALLRENGFAETDLMEGKDLENWLIKKIAGGSTTPEIVAAAARMLGVALPETTDERPPAEARPDPSLAGGPVRELPERTDGPDEIAAAAEGVVLRALERAGNRLKTRYGLKMDGVDACDLYRFSVPLKAADVDFLLEDAWGAAARLSIPVPVEALDAYVRQLLLAQKPFDPQQLRQFLRLRAQHARKVA